MLSRLVNFCSNRVLSYGQQYFYFGLFGLFNYPFAYLYRVFYEGVPEKENLFLRFSATILCIPLVMHKFIPSKFQRFLPLYWYFVITYSLPFLCTYLILLNQFSEEWIVNFGVALFIVILLIDWFMFIICISIGVLSGVFFYFLTHSSSHFFIPPEMQSIGLYLYACIFIIGSLFSKNKQQYHIDVIKLKNKLNAELSASLEVKSRKLVQAMDYNKQFVDNISHELRTPLHSILGLAEQLKNNYSSLKKSRILDVLSMIYSSAFSLSEMVNNLIDFSSYRQKKMKFNFKENNFKMLVEQCIETSRIYIASINKNLEIKLKYAEDVPEIIIIDAIRIQQVMNNLLSNAVKYSDDDSRKIEIRVLNIDGNNLRFEIIDQGIGVPEGEEEVIFNAFIRSSNTRNKDSGKGLGLTLIKEIITGHKGKIWAYNNAKKGATFTFVIPFAQGNKIYAKKKS